MALSLSAEQKDLKSLFINDDKYIIPTFQRPYSWTEEQLLQLYYDITNAFENGEDYFLGNIILAKSRTDKSILEIIDGQQRMVTLWLMLKALSVMLPTVPRLKSMIEIESWESDQKLPKIESQIYEATDNEQLKDIMVWEERDFIMTAPEGRLYRNAQKLYEWLEAYISRLSEEEKNSFWKYCIQSLYLLPIELSGETSEDAQSKALTIFETINNRGLDLEDADIFKAKLYNMAKHEGCQQQMINQWHELVASTTELGLRLDDIFRYYSHIIRGQHSITSNEKRLRDFYTREDISPLKIARHTEILADLARIIDTISLLEYYRQQPTRLGAWLQILKAYTNQYPWYALITYVYKNISDINNHQDKLQEFIEKLVRFCYISGSTTTIKYEIYSIISKIMRGEYIQAYFVEPGDFNLQPLLKNPRRLKTGLILLAFYLENPEQDALQDINVDRIIKSCDTDAENTRLPISSLSDITNYMVTDIPKRVLPYAERYAMINQSAVPGIRDLLPSNYPTEDFFQNRLEQICTVLTEFFTGCKFA